MRYLVLLSFLLVGCETFGLGETFDWGGKSAVQEKYSYCNIPLRLAVFRTSAEMCWTLGGHAVDDGKVDELQAYYLEMTGF